MSEDMLETLRAIDPAILTDVVRQDQQSSTFEILDWAVKRLSDKGIINPDGLFLFTGQGRDEQGERLWSVVLKILKGSHDDPNIRHMFYWKREFMLVQSGLLSNLPRPVVVPRFYAATEHENGAWLWMEYIVESVNRRWTTEQYTFAARQVGRFSAECLKLQPLPDYPWLSNRHLRDWLGISADIEDRDNPFVIKAFSSQLLERVTKLWDDSERFLNILDRLPQVFSHFDYQRRNLFIRQTAPNREELVVIDWALCGYGALGAELFSLLGDNMIVFEEEAEAMPELEAAAFPVYLEGLRDGGWTDNPEWVRLAYTTETALYLAAAAPALVTYWTSHSTDALKSFGRTPGEVASGWAEMCEFGLERGDEARQLMDKLGF